MKADLLDKLYDPIRREWVQALPEERVRQRLISEMQTLGYPLELMACEVSLRQLPHLALSEETIPKRRADLICFAQNIHPHFPLYPLLLIECKATPLTAAARRQLCGYNQSVSAPYICLANEEQQLFGFQEGDHLNYTFIDYLPRYKDLLHK